MFRKSIGLSALGLAGILTSAQALEIDGDAPTINILANINPTLKARIQTEMNAAIGTAFNSTLDEARANLSGFREQKKLANGFGNANAYSMNAGTLMGYQNYDLFAVSGGFMVGVQAPSTDPGYLTKAVDEISEKGDIYAGVGVGINFMNVGVNAGFLVPGLYLNARYGGMEQDVQDLSMKFTNFGIGANYRLLDSRSLAGIVKWRGISLGSGIYYQSSEINVEIEGDGIETEIPFRDNVVNSGADATERAALGAAMDELGFTAANPNATMTLTPVFNMGLEVSTTNIPIEASTAVSLLWGFLNLSAGVGTDLNFGTSKVVLRGDALAETATPDSDAVVFSDADVAIDGSSEDGPSFLRTRAMVGLGMGLGPVKIDLPVYYYLTSGMSFGVTAGVVW